VLPQPVHGLAHDLAVWQQRHHHVGGGHRRPHMISDSPAWGSEALARRLRHIKTRHRKARLDEAQAHGHAHIAEADHRDGSRRNDGGIGGHGAVLRGWEVGIFGFDVHKRKQAAILRDARNSTLLRMRSAFVECDQYNSDLILRRPPSWAAVSKDGHKLGISHIASIYDPRV
jgi:hypothetical protein